MTAIEFNNTTEDCGYQIHNSFENSYFGFMGYYHFEISQNSDGLILYLWTEIFGEAIFKNYPLSISDFI